MPLLSVPYLASNCNCCQCKFILYILLINSSSIAGRGSKFSSGSRTVWPRTIKLCSVTHMGGAFF